MYTRKWEDGMWYVSTSVWVLHTPNASQNIFFWSFCTFLQDFDAKIMKNEVKRAYFWLIPKQLLTKIASLALLKSGENTFSDTKESCIMVFSPVFLGAWVPLSVYQGLGIGLGLGLGLELRLGLSLRLCATTPP